MLKKFLMLIAMLYAAAAFAAVDVNKATPAELDGVKGIGPAISSKIVDERKKGAFKDWNDFIARVRGVGETSAARLSAQGLTVNGSSYSTVPAQKTTDKKDPAVKAPAEKAAMGAAAAPQKSADAAKPATDAQATQKASAAAQKDGKASATAPASGASASQK